MNKDKIGTLGVHAGYEPENGGPRQILIPHRGLYTIPNPYGPDSGQVGSDPGSGPRPQPRRFSCLTAVLIAMLVMFLIKACGG